MKRVAFLVVAVTVIALCYADVVRTLVSSMATSSAYSYGFLVFLVSGYIIWSKSAQLRALEPSPDYLLGIPVTLAGVGMLTAGRLGLLVSVQEASLVVTVAGFVLLFLGRRAFELLSFPLLYLLLGIPMWDSVIARLQPPSQLLSTKLAWGLLTVVGVPVLREGTQLVLPNVTLEVMRECSGVNQVLAIVSMLLPASFLTLRSNVRRALLVSLAVVTAYISNGIRITLVGFLAYHDLSNGDLRGLHLFEGLAVSVIGYLALFGCLSAMAKAERVKSRPEPPAGTDAAVASPASTPDLTGGRHPFLEHSVLILTLLVGISGLWFRPRAVPLRSDLRSFPKQVEDWSFDSRPEPYPIRFPAIEDELVNAYPSPEGERRFTAIDDELVRSYRNSAGEKLHLYVGYHRLQQEGKELVAEAGHLLDAAATPVYIQLPSSTVRVGQVVQDRPSGSRGLLYWYDLNGRSFSDIYLVKSYLAWDALTRRRTNGAVIMIGWEARDGSDPGRLRLEAVSFAHAVLTVLPRFIPS